MSSRNKCLHCIVLVLGSQRGSRTLLDKQWQLEMMILEGSSSRGGISLQEKEDRLHYNSSPERKERILKHPMHLHGLGRSQYCT